jgi:hypothetical protein
MPDNEYEAAVETVIDDHMRTDVLGSHFLRVLREHKPTSEQLVTMIAKEVGKDPALKKAVKRIVAEWNSENKMKWVNGFSCTSGYSQQ